jgi:hypothetical protein
MGKVTEGGKIMMRILLFVPKRVGCKTVWVKVTLSDLWSAECADAEIAARLDSFRPAWPLGYLPPPAMEWARTAERVLSARIESIQGPSGETPPGVVCSGI